MKMYAALLFMLSSFSMAAFGQEAIKPGYLIQESRRADDIIKTLRIGASSSAAVRQTLVQHFSNLNTLFNRRTAALAQLTGDDELSKARAKVAWDNEASNLNKLHAAFLGKLSATSLSSEEIEQIKDLMTEGGRLREFNNFLALLPDLNDKQKEQVMSYLKEARENAINAETAKDRVQWFIKYRGRANNFLAAAGYDLREATEKIEKIRLKKANVQSNSNL